MKLEHLIVGLGNPGPRYAATRHNVGFMVVDTLAERWDLTCWTQRDQAMCTTCRLHGQSVGIVKPLTFMNNSGQAVGALVCRFEIPLDRLYVVYDDVHLELATLRIRRRGSDGGHNGMKSIIQHLGSQDFPRVRIGIGNSQADRIEHVLGTFEETERAPIAECVAQAADALGVLVEQGVDEAMNRFNKRD